MKYHRFALEDSSIAMSCIRLLRSDVSCPGYVKELMHGEKDTSWFLNHAPKIVWLAL